MLRGLEKSVAALCGVLNSATRTRVGISHENDPKGRPSLPGGGCQVGSYCRFSNSKLKPVVLGVGLSKYAAFFSTTTKLDSLNFSVFTDFLKNIVWSLSLVQMFVTPRTVALQAPLSMGFPGKNGISRQEYWSGLQFPPPGDQKCISCIVRWVLSC